MLSHTWWEAAVRGRGFSPGALQSCRGCGGLGTQGATEKMWLLSDGAFPLLAMVLVNYVCVETALLRRSSAVDFLNRAREKRSVRCLPGGCSMEDSETEEVLEVNSDYEESLHQLNGGSKSGQNSSPDSKAALEDGSGM